MEKHITPKGGEGMYVLDTASWRVFRPVMDKEKCVECGMCMAYCPVNSVLFRDEKYVITYDYCKGCGICAKECPRDAIDMKTEADMVETDRVCADEAVGSNRLTGSKGGGQ